MKIILTAEILPDGVNHVSKLVAQKKAQEIKRMVDYHLSQDLVESVKVEVRIEE